MDGGDVGVGVGVETGMQIMVSEFAISTYERGAVRIYITQINCQIVRKFWGTRTGLLFRSA